MRIFRNCLGCCSQPPLIIAVDEPSNGLKIQGRTVKKASISEDFWSTSACEVDNSTFQSQRSMSSISTSNAPQDVSTSAGSSNHPTEFVNHGLLLWNQIRQQWIAKKSSKNRKEAHEQKISPSASYESLLGTNKPFPTPIPLPEMIDFLSDTWEQEGLYD
ncbi:uncharacterized protein LOC124931136 isoform X3 [Impatiens glandulifera]|uniref:uncharacterized protein LOC124931136 isoform X3 n=1 Tax=Impatiens glandulifera TaxID=253017 RepID=UPI001FB05069|nr:uncharacterized protein LOC124931136 isoform X3 [Impatiens glandulifera]